MSTSRTREIWVACHGYGQLAGPFAAALEPLRDNSRLVLAPEALNRFYLDDPRKRHGPSSPVGATWMTREERDSEIIDYVEYLDLVTATVRREIAHDISVVALGFSQGVATVCRWAMSGQTVIDRLILWAATLPVDLPTDRPNLFRNARVTLVAGTSDEVVPIAAIERDLQTLRARGIPADLVLYDGGHALNSAALFQLAAARQ